MTRYSYPHTIENGAGERLVFLRRVAGPAGDRLEGENLVKPGAGPPMHVHYLEEEVLTVQQGRMGYRRAGGPVQYAGPGETVAFAAGEGHRFWNAGDEDLRCTAYIQPVHNAEWFLTQLFDSARRSGRGRPDPFDVAFLLTRYRSEFALLEVPFMVQRLLFPAVAALGRLLGRYRRFADAPPPARR